MYNINILFNDYHNFNKNVKNHFNITKDNTDIDWDDFEKLPPCAVGKHVPKYK